MENQVEYLYQKEKVMAKNKIAVMLQTNSDNSLSFVGVAMTPEEIEKALGNYSLVYLEAEQPFPKITDGSFED